MPLQAESRTAELSSLLNKVQSEDAALKDSLAKLGSMNEGLAQDKVDLNTYIHQVCVWTLCPALCVISLLVFLIGLYYT